MLIKIFNRGKGTGDAPISYLLGDKFMPSGMQTDQLREGARILSGHPLVTQALINSSNFSKRYTSGVLSFKESPDALSDDVKQKIIADFEKMTFPGMHPDRYNILWVEHKDKIHPETGAPRLELNFLIATTELYTGKRLQPYFHAQDAKYFRAWQTLTNDYFNLSDPDDIHHRRVINPFDSNQSPKKTHKDLKVHIEAYLRTQMTRGIINHRDDVIREIESMPNTSIKVTRTSAKFISVTPQGSNKPIRLKGFVFDEDFDFEAYRARMQPDLDQNIAHQTTGETAALKHERLEQALVDFKAIYAHKANYNQKKYVIPEDEMRWVSQHYAPQFLVKPVGEPVNLGVLQEMIPADKQIQQATSDWLATANADTKDDVITRLDNSMENMMADEQAYRTKLAAKKAAEKRQQLQAEQLEQLEQQRRLHEKNVKAAQDREERRRILELADAMTAAIEDCQLGSDADEHSYKNLQTLIKDNFMLAVNQVPSASDTLVVGLGRFESLWQITRDGRVGIDDSPHRDGNQLTFFYSSDVFVLKEDRLYVNHTDFFYALSHFNDYDRGLLQDSVHHSELTKHAARSEPSGLAGAFVTYAAEVDVLPSQAPNEATSSSNGLANAFVTYHADLTVLPTATPKKEDDYGPGF